MAVSRRRAREIALQTLYQIALGGHEPETALAGVLEEQKPDTEDILASLNWESTQDYARALVAGVVEHGETYDAIIARYARDWDPDRMPTVDRVLLHIALHELQQPAEVPYGVVINEAVELAKQYSTEESGRFVNGILGTYSRTEGPEAPQR